MAGVVDGQGVNAAVTNPAFIFKNADDSTTKKLGLLNDEPESGAHVVNLQRAVNKSFEVGGIASESDDAANTYATEHRVAEGQNRKEAIEALDAAFDPTEEGSGHTHDGTEGQGPPLNAEAIIYQNDVSGLTSERVGQAIDELKALIDNLDQQEEVEIGVANNAVETQFLELNPVLMRSVWIKFDIVRKSDTALSEVREMGDLEVFYSDELDEWFIAGPNTRFWKPPGSSAEDSGVTFSVESIEDVYLDGTVIFGRLKLSSNEITGDNYYGFLNYRILSFTQS